MQRPFAVFDIDGTVIRWQLYHAIVQQLATDGFISEEAAHTINTARETWKNRTHEASFDTYEQVLISTYHNAIAAVTQSMHDQAVETVFQEYKDQTYTYTRDLIRRLKVKGYLLFAVSGSHQEIVEKLGAYYGFNEAVGAQYEVQDGYYAANRWSPVIDGKASVVYELIKKHNASWKGSVAIGDSPSDAGVLELVDHPIAFNPDRELYARAKREHWKIIIERKNVVYKLEPRDDEHYVLA